MENPDTCDYKESATYEMEEGQTLEDMIKLAGFNSEDVAMAFVKGRVVGFDTVLSDGDRIGLTSAFAALKASLRF